MLGWTPFDAPQDQPADQPHVLDNRFRVLGPIGRGGMGKVQLCEDLTLRSEAAVKVLRSTGTDMRRRFRDEAILLANLRHPHLVQVLAVGETEEGFPYIAMEHLGQSLDRRLRRGKTLPWREAVEIGIQIAEALSTLHRAGVVHRDVKPANIAELRGVTGRVFVKLIDLGVASVEDLSSLQRGGESAPPRRRTKEGKILGTPGYTPPEAGLCEPDARFDVYGLGAAIFELCTGVVPDALDRKAMRSIKPELDLPKELDSLVARAIEVVPESRIATAAEFSKGLADVLERYPEGSQAALFDGCYELIQLLGIGAKAEVYWAYHRDARRVVALKVLRDDVLENTEERERFDREARILSAVKHPSLPALIECRTSAERRRPFIAMGLCRGRRATEFLEEPLSPREVIAVGQQLASALVALHERGVIHRDLNRTNVLIDRSEGNIRASVIDLGQAELLDEFYAGINERYPTPPEARTRLGTGGLEHAQWTAPEARSDEGWTTKSDVYSLGLLLFILLTGKIPIKEEDGGWSSPADLVPESEGPLAEAILGALNVDPSHRFDAPGLLGYLDEAECDLRLQELEEARALQEDASAPTTDARTISQPPGVHRRLRIAASVVGVAALCLVSWSLGRSSQGSTAVRSHPPVGETAEVDREVRSPAAVTDVASPAEVLPAALPPPVAPSTLVPPTAGGPATTSGTAGVTDGSAVGDGSSAEPTESSGDTPSEIEGPGPQPSRASTPSGSGLSRRAFRKVIDPKLHQLGLCALRATEEDGDVVAKLRIGASGELVSHTLSREVPWVVERCIGKIFEQLSFPPSGAVTTHRLTISRS